MKLQSNSGQAMMEMALSMIIFVLLIGAAASYYKVMRTAVIRQEVARNLIFAKINNAGSLTTLSTRVAPRGGSLDLGRRLPVSESGGGTFIDRDDTCFAVIPGDDAEMQVPVIYEGNSGATETKNIEITTYAVIYRRAGRSCVN